MQVDAKLRRFRCPKTYNFLTDLNGFFKDLPYSVLIKLFKNVAYVQNIFACKMGRYFGFGVF